MQLPKLVTNMLVSWRSKPTGQNEYVQRACSKGVEQIASKEDLLRMLHGYTSACQHVIASAVSGLDIRTYKNGEIQAQEVTDSLLSCLITDLNRQDLLYKLANDLTMTGNCWFLRGEDNSFEYIAGDVSVKKWRVYNSVIFVPETYTIKNKEPMIDIDVSASQIIHFKYRLLSGSVSGRGALEDCILEQSTSVGISRFVNAYFRNGAIPGLHVRIKKGNMKRNEFEQVAEDLTKAFSEGGVGGTLVTSDGINSNVVGNSVVDSKSTEIQNLIKNIILATYGVPIDILDSTNTNRATAAVSQRLFFNNTILPLAWSICYTFNKVFESDGYRFEPVPYDTVDPIEGDKQVTEMFEKGILTKDETRGFLRSVALKNVVISAPSTSEDGDDNENEE